MFIVNELEDQEIRITLGTLHDIEINVTLDQREEEMIQEINLLDLDPQTLQQIQRQGEMKNNAKNTLGMFTDPIRDDFEITRNQYYGLLALKETILYKRSIPNREYLPYVLFTLNIDELKEICRDYKLKGYSSMKKDEMVHFITDSFTEQEIRSFLKESEKDILEKEIKRAIQILKARSSEKLKTPKVINEQENEIELDFSRTFNNQDYPVNTFISINDKNIHDPLRDCDCNRHESRVLCRHFWTAFIILARNKRFNLDQWNFSALPKMLIKYIKK